MDNNEVTIKVEVPKDLLKSDKETRTDIFESVVEKTCGEVLNELGEKELRKIGSSVVGMLTGAYLYRFFVDGEDYKQQEELAKIVDTLNCAITKAIKKDISIVLEFK